MKKIVLGFVLVLASIAAAEITYPVDVTSTRWAIMEKDTGRIIARNKQWPVADGSEIPGLSTNLVYLRHVTDAAPQYDSRLYSLTSTETSDPEANTITKTYQTVERPKEEIKTVAQNREMQEMSKQGVNLAREVLETRLMVTALIQYTVDNQQLPPKVQTYAEQYRTKGVKLWKNRDRVKELLEAIDSGQPFDLDAGWEPSTSTNAPVVVP